MTIDRILASLDTELARLIQARELLSNDGTKSMAAPQRKRRKLSKAARERIAAAQRRRWAKQRTA